MQANATVPTELNTVEYALQWPAESLAFPHRRKLPQDLQYLQISHMLFRKQTFGRKSDHRQTGDASDS